MSTKALTFGTFCLRPTWKQRGSLSREANDSYKSWCQLGRKKLPNWLTHYKLIPNKWEIGGWLKNFVSFHLDHVNQCVAEVIKVTVCSLRVATLWTHTGAILNKQFISCSISVRHGYRVVSLSVLTPLVSKNADSLTVMP